MLVVLIFLKITLELVALESVHAATGVSRYEIHLNRFNCIKLSTSNLFGLSSEEQMRKEKGNNTSNISSLARDAWDGKQFKYMVMAAGEAALPRNWDHVISADDSQLMIFGFPVQLETKLEIEIWRLENNKSQSRLAQVVFEAAASAASEGRSRQPDVVAGSSPSGKRRQQEMRITFQRSNLAEFLMRNHHVQVEAIFSNFIWPESRVVQVSGEQKSGNESNGSTRVVIRNEVERQSKLVLDSIERLVTEINVATRGGRLCEYKRSKSIQVEHYFRELGLYPSWCKFEFRSYMGEDGEEEEEEEEKEEEEKAGERA